MLIAYFSRADENYFGGAMRYVKVGNTEIQGKVAQEDDGSTRKLLTEWLGRIGIK